MEALKRSRVIGLFIIGQQEILTKEADLTEVKNVESPAIQTNQPQFHQVYTVPVNNVLSSSYGLPIYSNSQPHHFIYFY